MRDTCANNTGNVFPHDTRIPNYANMFFLLLPASRPFKNPQLKYMELTQIEIWNEATRHQYKLCINLVLVDSLRHIAHGRNTHPWNASQASHLRVLRANLRQELGKLGWIFFGNRFIGCWLWGWIGRGAFIWILCRVPTGQKNPRLRSSNSSTRTGSVFTYSVERMRLLKVLKLFKKALSAPYGGIRSSTTKWS